MIVSDRAQNPANPPAPATLRSIDLRGPAGRLEALVNDGSPDAPYAALVCHPHPKGGGTLHNKVVYHAMKALNAPEFGLGWPVLRFNFRGTGLSEGTHDGRAETEDVLAALSWLENEYNRPLFVAGFSFGAAMSLLAVVIRLRPTATNTTFAPSLPSASQPALKDITTAIPFFRIATFPSSSSAETRTSTLLPLTSIKWPPPRPNQKSWCSYPAPITFFRASLKRCRTCSRAGARNKCHDPRERYRSGLSAR